MKHMDTVDPQAILATLGYAAATVVAPISGGRDTAIWRVEHAGRRYALRVFRPEQLEMSQREQRAMQLAAAGGVPVPRIAASGVYEGRPTFLLDWCVGTTVVEAVTHAPESAHALGIACGRVLAGIHGVTVPDTPPTRTWLDWGGLGDEPLRDRLQGISQPDRLLHLDFHPLNIMVHNGEITGVLDWGNARPGDPRADLARARSILLLDSGALTAEQQAVVRAFDTGLLTGYESVAGPHPNMPLFYAWAGRAMLRDLAPRLHESQEQRARIEAWIARWLHEA